MMTPAAALFSALMGGPAPQGEGFPMPGTAAGEPFASFLAAATLGTLVEGGVPTSDAGATLPDQELVNTPFGQRPQRAISGATHARLPANLDFEELTTAGEHPPLPAAEISLPAPAPIVASPTGLPAPPITEPPAPMAPSPVTPAAPSARPASIAAAIPPPAAPTPGAAPATQPGATPPPVPQPVSPPAAGTTAAGSPIGTPTAAPPLPAPPPPPSLPQAPATPPLGQIAAPESGDTPEAPRPVSAVFGAETPSVQTRPAVAFPVTAPVGVHQDPTIQRIIQIAESAAGSPQAMVVEIPETDGARLLVSMRGDAVHVSVANQGGGLPGQNWLNDLATALTTRGFVPEGLLSDGRHGRRAPHQAREDLPPDSPPLRPRTRSRTGLTL